MPIKISKVGDQHKSYFNNIIDQKTKVIRIERRLNIRPQTKTSLKSDKKAQKYLPALSKNYNIAHMATSTQPNQYLSHGTISL